MTNNRFTDMFSDANDSFDKAYESELEKLKGLTPEEINSIAPAEQGTKALNNLIQVVDKASSENLSQGELISNIKSLGSTAISIAKLVPGLASIL